MQIVLHLYDARDMHNAIRNLYTMTILDQIYCDKTYISKIKEGYPFYPAYISTFT